MPSSQSSFSILILSAGLKAISWIEKFAVNGYWELYEPAGGNANPSTGTEDFEEGRITENASNPLERDDPRIPSHPPPFLLHSVVCDASAVMV